VFWKNFVSIFLRTKGHWYWCRGKKNAIIQFWKLIVGFFVANTFQTQPFHKGLAMQADVVNCRYLILTNPSCTTNGRLKSQSTTFWRA
jgi:hypothetical protein